MSRKWGSVPTPAAPAPAPSSKAIRATFCCSVIVGSKSFTSVFRPEVTDLGVICALNMRRILVPWSNVTCVELEG